MQLLPCAWAVDQAVRELNISAMFNKPIPPESAFITSMLAAILSNSMEPQTDNDTKQKSNCFSNRQ